MTVLDGVQLKATGRVRSNFANAHLLHAHRFALEVHACETANQGEELGNFYDEIRAKTVATVISAAASLEAYVNEVPFDLEQNFPEQPTDLLRIAIDLQERRTLRERIDLLPQLKGNKSPNFGRSPAQDVGLLITRPKTQEPVRAQPILPRVGTVVPESVHELRLREVVCRKRQGLHRGLCDRE